MLVSADTAALQLGNEGIDSRLIFIARNDYAVDLQLIFAEHVDEPHDFKIIGDTEVLTGLVGKDIARIDTDDDLGVIFHLGKQLDLGILVKARQDAGSMLVLNQLASELQVEPFPVTFVDTFQNIF